MHKIVVYATFTHMTAKTRINIHLKRDIASI